MTIQNIILCREQSSQLNFISTTYIASVSGLQNTPFLSFLFFHIHIFLSFPFIFPHFLAPQTPLSLLQWPTSSPTTRSPSSRRPSASSTRTAMVSLFRSLSLCFSLSLTLVLVFACFLDLIFAISL